MYPHPLILIFSPLQGEKRFILVKIFHLEGEILLKMKKNKLKNTLKVSYLDGLFASIMTGFSETFMTPYCLALKGTTRQIAALVSLPNLFSALFQLKSSDMIARLKSRKKVVVTCVLLHALMWVPIISIPYFPKINTGWYLIAFVILYTALNGFAIPAWSSMMSDYIPGGSRGKYFGWRNRTLGLVVVLSAFIAGFILRYVNKNEVLFGFTLIFSIACVSRLVSWYFLTRMHEAKLKISKEAYFTFWDFIKRIRESNFAKFVFFVGSMSFTVNLASPFFAVYMLRDLNMDYMTYTVVVASATLTTLIMMAVWGRYCDVVGNIRVLKTSSLFVPLIPLLWLFSSNVFYLIIIQIFAGFFWAGFNLSASNFIYDAVSAPKRSRCVAYFNVVNVVAIFLGATLGGLLAGVLPAIKANRLLCLFSVSAAARAFVTYLFYNKVIEVRPRVKKVSSIELFSSIFGVNPILGVSSGTLLPYGEKGEG